jgi:aryl-alcohol dehydrogenase-like predicted oxidoreductase
VGGDVADGERRDRIAGAAARCFARWGYIRTRMEDIAREAGIARPALYRYYAGKEALLLEVLVRHIEQLARQKQCTPAQLALAWLLARGRDIVPIPGTKRREFLEENVGALEVQLSAEDLARIDAIAPRGVASGLRYAEGGMATVNR